MTDTQHMLNLRNRVECEKAFLAHARSKKLGLEWVSEYGYHKSCATEREWQVFKAEWLRKNPLVK